jgi:hypothetical protein
MGGAMVASGVSTVVVTTPLFATTTRILNSFAVVIAITMAIGLTYTFLFLTPAIGLFGPDKAHSHPKKEWAFKKHISHTLYSSKAVRFVGVMALMIALMVRSPLRVPLSAVCSNLLSPLSQDLIGMVFRAHMFSAEPTCEQPGSPLAAEHTCYAHLAHARWNEQQTRQWCYTMSTRWTRCCY